MSEAGEDIEPLPPKRLTVDLNRLNDEHLLWLMENLDRGINPVEAIRRSMRVTRHIVSKQNEGAELYICPNGDHAKRHVVEEGFSLTRRSQPKGPLIRRLNISLNRQGREDLRWLMTALGGINMSDAIRRALAFTYHLQTKRAEGADIYLCADGDWDKRTLLDFVR